MKTRRPMKKWMLAVGLAAILFLSLTGVRYYNRYRLHLEKQTRFMMDTFVTIYAVGPRKATLPIVKAALDRMQTVDAKFNSLNPQSPIYAFNHQGVPLADPEILKVVRLALQIARDTDGAFDITVAPLIELWGFYGDSPHLPGATKIKDCLKNIDYRQLKFKNGHLERTGAQVRIDLGGIAKGYAIQQAAEVLRRGSLTSALIDAGGDVYALGKKGPISGRSASATRALKICSATWKWRIWPWWAREITNAIFLKTASAITISSIPKPVIRWKASAPPRCFMRIRWSPTPGTPPCLF